VFLALLMLITSNEGPESLVSLLQEGGVQTKSLITICSYDVDILLIAHVFIFVVIIL